MRILRLTPNNLGEFRQLMELFEQEFQDEVSYGSKPPGDSYVATLLAKPHIILLVALDRDRVVGGLAAYVLEKFEQERSEIYVYDLAVAENYRRRGIATRLIKQLCDIAKGHNAWVAFIQADYGDEPAIKLYESLGLREDVIHFDIPIARG